MICTFTESVVNDQTIRQMNRNQLISDLKKGNNDILKTFYEQFANYCKQRLTNENRCSREDAEDIFIESLMNLREKLINGKVKSIANVKSYLYNTCHNMLLVRLEQEAKHQKYASDLERFYYESEYNREGMEYDPELMNITKKSWDLLPERCKDILHLYYVDKVCMKEIAGLMDLSNADVAKTTKSRCYKKWIEKAIELKTRSIPRQHESLELLSLESE